MRVRWSNDLLLEIHWLFLLVILLLFLRITLQVPQFHWASVAAQIIDAEVIKTQHTQYQQSPKTVMIQLVYRYTWDNREYVNRGMVKQSSFSFNHDELTTVELRRWLFSESLKPDSTIELWVNPDHPSQAIVAWHTGSQSAWLVILSCFIILLLYLWYISRR